MAHIGLQTPVLGPKQGSGGPYGPYRAQKGHSGALLDPQNGQNPCITSVRPSKRGSPEGVPEGPKMTPFGGYRYWPFWPKPVHSLPDPCSEGVQKGRFVHPGTLPGAQNDPFLDPLLAQIRILDRLEPQKGVQKHHFWAPKHPDGTGKAPRFGPPFGPLFQALSGGVPF